MPKAQDDLVQALARARDLKPRLEAAADELNRSIEAVESTLSNMQLGVRASITMESLDEDGWSRDLTFGKESRTWRLLIEDGFSDPEMPHSTTPLLNCSREIRLNAAELLPDLVRKMVATAEEEIRRVETATAMARKVAAALSSEEPK
ncbi:hypothetical protein [Corallococcus terminator]|nr:hypothetical protein [Corallococcus terminator]